MNKLLHWRKIAFYLALPVLAFVVFMEVHFKTDLSAFIVAGDNAEEILLASEMQSGVLSRRYMLSVGTGDGKAVPGEFMQAFRARLKQIDGVLDSWSPEQQNDNTHWMETLYSRHGGALYSLNGEQVLDDLFTQKGLERRAEFLKEALLSPQGAMIKKIALQDPLLLTLTGFQSLAGQMHRPEAQGSPYRNLILETSIAGFDAALQGPIQDEIKSVFDRLNPSYQERMQLDMTGVPVFAVATQKLIQDDINRVGLVSTAGQIVLFLLIFRSIGSLIQVFTLLGIVILSSMLATQLAFGYVHGMTVAIGSTLMGICIDYPIHALAHAQAAAIGKRTEVIAEIWPSMLLGGFTTMVGYAALGASGYPGFQQIAVYAATGIVVALLLTRFVLPMLIAANSPRPLHVPGVAGWTSFCQRFRPWLIALLLSAVGLSLFGLKSLSWLQDMQDLTPELNYLKENDKRIRQRMVSIEPGRFILVTGHTTEAALQKTEQVYTVLEQLKQEGSLSDYFGLHPWLLSAQTQQQNQRLLRHYLTEDNLRLWRQALKDQGLSVKHLGQLDYPEVAPLTLEQLLASPVKKMIDSRVLAGDRQTVVTIWLAEHRPEALQAAFDKMQDACYVSQHDLLNKITLDYTQRTQVLFAAGMALIFLVLLVRYKSLRRTAQTLFPSMMAALLILSLWSLSGTAISFLHLVGFLLVVSICDDYSIFFQENRGGNMTLTYQSMAASMLSSVLAFGCLGMAETASLRILAGVVAFGILLGFLLCPLIIIHEPGKSPQRGRLRLIPGWPQRKPREEMKRLTDRQ
ncbi:MAG: MMPL family transporter [Methylosarcina sp.]